MSNGKLDSLSLRFFSLISRCVSFFPSPSLPYHQIDGVVKYSILISAVLIPHTTQSSFYLDTPFAILGTETITLCWTTKSFLVNNPLSLYLSLRMDNDNNIPDLTNLTLGDVDFNSKTVPQLRALCKLRGLKG